MAKRLTDTDKWKDPWFDNLSGTAKLFFYYLIDHVDCAGIWKTNFSHFEKNTGFKYSADQMQKDFNEKMTLLSTGNYLLVSFVKVQYVKLSEKSSVFTGIQRSLNNNGLKINPFTMVIEDLQKGSESVLKGFNNPLVRDKDKDKDNNTIYINNSLYAENNTLCSDDWSEKINQDSIITMFNSTCAGKGKIKPFRSYFFSQNMIDEFFKITGDPLFRKIETWQEAFDTVAHSQFLTHEFNTTLNWILNHDNLQKILSGQYQTRVEPQKSLKNDPASSGNESDKLFDRILSAGRNGLAELKKELTVLEFRVIQEFGSMLEIYNATSTDIPRVKKKFRDCYIEIMKQGIANEQKN